MTWKIIKKNAADSSLSTLSRREMLKATALGISGVLFASLLSGNSVHADDAPGKKILIVYY